jgi:hypothetical protein
VPTPVRASIAISAGVLLAVALGACAAGSGAPTDGPDRSAMPSPVPSPGAVEVSSPEDAAARVIASDPRFAGATLRQPDSIGLSKWWEWKALGDGGYEISLTLGWGDCPAGCINHHTWVFDVAADGTVTKTTDSGDPVPAGS